MRQFRTSRRRFVPYKSPRIGTMLALLVCLFLVMLNLRSFREPGQNALRIISNLNQAQLPVNAPPLKPSSPEMSGTTQVAGQEIVAPENNVSESNQAEGNASENSAPGASEPAPVPAVHESPATDANSGDPQAADGSSNLTDSQSLNLREDLQLQDWLGLVQDGTLALQKLEMPAYWRMLRIVNNTSFKSLLSHADAKVRFNELYSSAAKNRSKLITLNVNVRKIAQYTPENNPAGIDVLYEVWGWSDTSKAWLYVFVTPELPPGLDAHTQLNQKATFAGYFYKLQGYQPGGAKPNAKPLLAPLLIGKFEVVKAAQRVVAAPVKSIEMIVGAAILLVGVTAILLRVFVFQAKKPRLARPRSLPEFNGFPPDFTATPPGSDAKDKRY